MKIGIDTQTVLGQKTGFGFYVKNLVDNLKKIDKNNQYVLIKPNTDKDLNAPKRFIWDQFKVPIIAKKNKVDILHQPCFSAPVFYSGKIIVTIHDLIAIFYSQDIPFFSRQYFGKWMPYSYRFADKIICDSYNTQKDVISILGISEEKTKVIPLAVSGEFVPISDKAKIDQIKQKYNTGDKYFFHVGTLSPRKNLEFLINVFYEISKKHQEYKLIITGKKGWYYEGLFNLSKKLNLKDRVIFTGYIDDQDKPFLYNGAKLLLFPSLYEGFGLPPLEAMSCMIPVISSNTSSMPEVIGNGGVLLSPRDKDGWVKEIDSLITNRPRYQKLANLAYQQSKKFSWEKTARETLEVYKEVYENSN
jgi:glycosyltransferase involved in cell wall biosynthesis